MRGTRFLDLNQCVHDFRGRREPSVTIRTATSCYRDVDLVFACSQARTLAEDRGRIQVVIASLGVHGSRHRYRARLAVHFDFPTTHLAITMHG